jgi:hypothetical protein
MTYDTLEQSQSALLSSQSTSSQSAVATVLSTLTQYEPDKTGLIDAIKVEYLTNKNMLNEPTALTEEFGADIPESYFYQPNRTAQEFADLARLSVGHITADCGVDTGLPEVADKIVNEELRIYEPIEFFEPNFIGQVFLSVTAGSFSETRDNYCEAAARHESLLADFQQLREQAMVQQAATTADTIQIE